MTDNFQSIDIDVWQEGDPAKTASTYLENSDAISTTVYGRKKGYSEAADDYPDIITRLTPEWRIILCRDGIQWILQRLTGNRWRGQSYCRPREGLLRCIHEKVIGDIDPCSSSLVETLPDDI